MVSKVFFRCFADTTSSPSHYEDGRASPADSLSSSGVSSCSSPLRASPELSPKSPKTYTRTPGGRTSYAPNQVRAMEKLFAENRYPDYDLLEKLSADLGIPIKKIKVSIQTKSTLIQCRTLIFPYYQWSYITLTVTFVFCFQVWFQNKRARTKSRYQEVSFNSIAGMIPSVPTYGMQGFPMMSLPMAAPMMSPYPIHPLQTPFQPYMC